MYQSKSNANEASIIWLLRMNKRDNRNTKNSVNKCRTLRQANGLADRKSVHATLVSTGVQGYDSSLVLYKAMLGCNPWALDVDVRGSMTQSGLAYKQPPQDVEYKDFLPNTTSRLKFQVVKLVSLSEPLKPNVLD